MEKIINKLKETIKLKPNAVIGIDGCCASGKTTFAKKLADEFGAQIIHMDDFFLPFEMRTEERLAEAGGNVHYERFNDEVVSGLNSGRNFNYRVFSCRSGGFLSVKTVTADKPIIIEGSYAFHPEIENIYSFKIFMKTDYTSQLERIKKRNGDDALEAFKSKWIPLENTYFAFFGIEESADTVIET